MVVLVLERVREVPEVRCGGLGDESGPVGRNALRGVYVRELLAVEGLAPAARGVGGAPSPDVEGGGLIY